MRRWDYYPAFFNRSLGGILFPTIFTRSTSMVCYG